MVNLQKIGNSAVKFVFTDSDHYLYGNGEIEVPVNSLLLVIDESDMVTFKKLSGDPFLSFRADNSNLGTKAAIEQFYKDNMVGSSGGDGSGVTPSEVQTMIDESISGKADTTYVNQIATQATEAITALTQTVSNNYTEHETEIEAMKTGKFGDVRYDSATHRINFYYDNSALSPLAYVDASDFIKDGMVSNVEIVNGNLVITFNSDAGKQPISIPLTDIFNPANYYTTGQTDALLAAKADTATTYTKTEVDAALNAKVDTSAITTAITSGSTDSEIPTAKAVYDATQSGGGGATYSAGTNISIDTANTINCTLNLRNGTGQNSLLGTGANRSTKKDCFAFGENAVANGAGAIALGAQSDAEGIYSFIGGGIYLTTQNNQEAAFGVHNVSTTGSTASGQTLFSVGNGANRGNKHNAFEIRQNGDLYFADTDNTTYANYYQKPMVRLQDMYGALGGLKFVQCTQAEYSAMEQAGTLDSSTLYIISNVVS